MCLFSVRREDDYEPVRISERRTRVVHRHDRVPSVRASRVSVHSTHRVPALPAPSGLAVPAPQPVPVFVKPPTPPPAAPEAHYVTVSPRSSSEDSYYRREVRVERDYSPPRSHSHRSHSRRRSRSRDDRYEYRYIEPPREELRYEPPRRSRSRHRSRSRADDDYDYDYVRSRERTYYD